MIVSFFFFIFSIEGSLRDLSTFQERILKIGKGVVFDQKPTDMKIYFVSKKVVSKFRKCNFLQLAKDVSKPLSH